MCGVRNQMSNKDKTVSITSTTTTAANTGLYSGNVVIEFNTDQKVVKPVVKVNEKATMDEVKNAVSMAIFALHESTKALDSYDFVTPDPVKLAIITENKLEGVYKNNDEITNNKQTGVDSHLEK